jgi:acyl carrier protein
MTLLGGPAAGDVDLPTYPFRRDRYWLAGPDRPSPSPSAELSDVDWPVLAPAPARTAGRRWAFLGEQHPGLPVRGPGGGQPVMHPTLGSLDRALAAGAPDVVFASCAGGGGVDVAADARASAHRALSLLQEWLGDDRLARTRLVFLTRGAVAVRPGEPVADLAAAATWGLVRAAAVEHPGRFAVVDLDPGRTDHTDLADAVAAEESPLAIRAGRLHRLALTPAGPPQPADPAGDWDPSGTVLISGGTGALGRLLAVHLVRRHGVRHLLLLSRRGPASALVSELDGLDARATVLGCDVADRDRLAAALAGIPAAHPLTAVVHTAGVLADSTVARLTPAQLDRVLRPKVQGAVNLDALTADRPLAAFVLFSSTVSLLGGAGQANYAAANAFLNALAHRRRDRGLPALSLAWGPWDVPGGMADGLRQADQARLTGTGLVAVSAAEGLARFDRALRRDVPVQAAIRPPAPTGPSTHDGHPPLHRRLIALTEDEQRAALVELVRAAAASVLGHTTADAIDPAEGFFELGLDSLTALELHDHLTAATGLHLPATVALEAPTPVALAGLLHTHLLR